MLGQALTSWVHATGRRARNSLGIELVKQGFRAVYLVERLANDRGVHGDRTIVRGVEPVAAGNRVNIAVEHQTDDPPIGIDQWAARVSADNVVVGRDTERRVHIQLLLHLGPTSRYLK